MCGGGGGSGDALAPIEPRGKPSTWLPRGDASDAVFDVVAGAIACAYGGAVAGAIGGAVEDVDADAVQG